MTAFAQQDNDSISGCEYFIQLQANKSRHPIVLPHHDKMLRFLNVINLWEMVYKLNRHPEFIVHYSSDAYNWNESCFVPKLRIRNISQQETYSTVLYDGMVIIRWKMPSKLRGGLAAQDVIKLIALLPLLCLKKHASKQVRLRLKTDFDH